jgi:hypothetical protein
MNKNAKLIQIKKEARSGYTEMVERQFLFGVEGDNRLECRRTRGEYYIVVSPGAKDLYGYDQVHWRDCEVLEVGEELKPFKTR